MLNFMGEMILIFQTLYIEIHLMKHSNVSQSKFFINGHLNIQCECTPFTVCQSYKSLQLHPLGTSLLTLDKDIEEAF